MALNPGGRPGAPGAAVAHRAAGLAGLRLDSRQALFVEHVARGVPHKDAARLAGYDSPPHSALQSKAVRHAISLTISEILQTEGAPVALDLLIKTVRNDKENSRVRVDAAKTILDRAGHVARPKEADSGAQKDLHEMSTDELRALVDKLEGELADRAEPVSATEKQGVPQQVLDMLE